MEYFFYTPENKETKTKITLCSVLTEAASGSALEEIANIP